MIPALNNGRFIRHLEHFRKLVLTHDGRPFSTFETGLPNKEEGYKVGVYDEGRRRLGWAKWTEAEVGTGEIMRRVISAIEIKESNLVDWDLRRGPKARSHHALCVALETKSQLTAWESLFFDFYRDELSAEDTFGELIKLAGKRYDLIAYLYFLKDWSQFAPIATQSFDKAFEILGVDLKTSWQCSWENYQAYLSVLGQVRTVLRVECYDDVRLIDAHSFCWMLAGGSFSKIEAESQKIASPTQVTGVVKAVVKPPNVAGGQPASGPVDWEKLRRRQAEVGRLAEDAALQSEKRRLEEEGRTDLAEKAKIVSDDYVLGFDIKSFNTDGSDRHIEVKAVRISGGITSFFLSENELVKSRELPSYFFYLVFDPREARVVKCLAAAELVPELLSPVTHEARFKEA